jgi:Tol biopolymer transport system component
MSKRSDSEPNPDLERLLSELYREPRPDPAFVEDLERRLLQPRRPVSRLRQTFAGLFALAPNLAWGAAAAALVLALAWTLGNLVPHPMPAVEPTHTQPAVSPTVTLTPARETPGGPAGGVNPSPAPTRRAGPTAIASLTATPTLPSGLYPGWLRYANSAYGFSFSYPPDWTLEEGPHVITLRRLPMNRPVLNIGFRRSAEDVGIQHPNAVTGTRQPAGTVIFLGKEIPRELVVEEDREKAVLYNRGAEIRTNDGLYFTLTLVDVGSGPAALTEEAQMAADRMARSFRLLAEESSAVGDGYLGRVAFVRDGSLWAIDLPGGEPKQLASGGRPREPRWSPSGGWLAFRKDANQVWTVRADGTRAVALNAGGGAGVFAWSPRQDRLAYVAGEGELRLASAAGKDLQVLVPRSGSSRIHRLAWSPAGDWIAYQLIQPKAGQEHPAVSLWKVPVEGGRPAELYSGNPTLAGWTGDGRALLFWDGGETFSGSLLADGVPLMLLPASGGEPQRLARSVLVYADSVRADPSGSSRVAVVAGGNRESWTNKVVYLFSGTSGAVLSSADLAAASPAWSLDGQQIAYSAAADAGAAASETALQARRLWARDLRQNKTRQMTNDPAYRDEYPLWSAGGESLLFVRVDRQGMASLWLIPSGSGELVQVVDSVSTAAQGEAYYGYIDWSSVLDWWR